MSEEERTEESTQEESSVEDVASDENTQADPSDGSTEESVEETTTEELPEVVEQGATQSFAEETASPTDDNYSETENGSRAQKRIQKLLSDNQRLRSEQQAPMQQPVQPVQPDPAFTPNADGEIELTPEQLQGYVQQTVASSIQLEKSASDVRTKNEAWHSDLTSLVKDTPELNPKDGAYNADLDDMLTDLIRDSNVDAQGQLTARILPSQVWDRLQKSMSTAKTAGAKETRANIKRSVENSAVQNTVAGSDKGSEYSDKQINDIAATDPQRYAELIRTNQI